MTLVAAVLMAQPELDCATPDRARLHLGRLRLAEIEYAEDVHQEELGRALGRCPEGRAGEACRTAERRKSEQAWEHVKAAIEAKYARLLQEYEERCRTSPA
jgi:hypothetical protein